MVGISVIPFFCQTSQLTLSIYSFILVLLLGIWFTYKSILLYKNIDDLSARKLMLSSFLYLPVMQIIYVMDRFIFKI
jgi:protoheme IX farnesyltransferase